MYRKETSRPTSEASVLAADNTEQNCVIWHNSGDKAIYQDNDVHIAWSRASLYNTGIELGLDGSCGGNNLRLINHSDHPNVKLETVANTEHLSDSPHAFKKLSLAPELVDDHSIIIVAIADRDINQGEELAFRYQVSRVRNPIDFSRVGENIQTNAAI